MKLLVVITAFFILLKPVFPVVEYAVNYSYVSKVLCENKAKPEMHCNGKCHLMKELAKAAESEKPASQNQNDKKVFSPLELFCNTASEIHFPVTFAEAHAVSNYHYEVWYGFGFDGNVFHPPILI